jgi:Domain of unknown function (DUF4371)
VLEKHIKWAVKNPHKTHYLGKNIQQEIISSIAKATRDKILNMIKNAMYFSVIVDCTPDKSHKEQMSIVVRLFTLHFPFVLFAIFFFVKRGKKGKTIFF